jgi:hypothetical protein
LTAIPATAAVRRPTAFVVVGGVSSPELGCGTVRLEKSESRIDEDEFWRNEIRTRETLTVAVRAFSVLDGNAN